MKYLLDSEKERKEMGRAAYHTMAEEWNPDVAAKRLIRLIEDLMQKKDGGFEKGPCSKAENINNNWYI